MIGEGFAFGLPAIASPASQAQAGLIVTPRIGHLHITVDDATWHWVDASGEPLVVQGLEAGHHAVRIDLADPTHRVIDSHTVTFEIPPRRTAP